MLVHFSSRRPLALYLLVWLMLGLLFAGLIIVASGAPWFAALCFAIPTTLVYAVASGFSSYYLCRAYPLAARGVAATLLVFCFAAMVAGALRSSLCALWNAMLGAFGAAIAIGPGLNATIFGLGVILYGLAAVAHYLAIEFERVRSLERRELELRLLAQDAELRMLRTQIDPHFLFNSLNSISALTTIDPARARAMTLRLADFFRHSLGLEAHRLVTLAAETELVAHFLAIEQVRFGARLRVEQVIDDAARACLLPPLILQPLVENAVKHGIGGLAEGGAIRISAARTGSILRIGVDNDVDPDPEARAAAASAGHGIGLVNVRQRLACAYGHEASVNWSREGGRFRVALSLPAVTHAPETRLEKN